MPALMDTITIETDLFEHRKVQPHFINACCFGEDFASWLRQELKSFGDHPQLEISEPIQEDYGWGLWVRIGADPFWIALSYVGVGPQEPPAEWVISVAYDPGFNLIKRVFHRPDREAFSRLRHYIWQVLGSNPAIRVLP